MDFLNGGGRQLELNIMRLEEAADVLFFEKTEAEEKQLQLASQLQILQSEFDKLKKEQIDLKEANVHKDKKFQDERIAGMIDFEKLKALNEELKASAATFKSMYEKAASEIQDLKTALSPIPKSEATRAGGVVSDLVTKEVIDNLHEIHQQLKALEARTANAEKSVKTADMRALDSSKSMERAQDLLKRAMQELEVLRQEHKHLLTKSRNDEAANSALKLDREVIDEQVNRLREEIVCLNQTRRNLEAELEKTKYNIAMSLLPMIGTSPPTVRHDNKHDREDGCQNQSQQPPTALVLFRGNDIHY